MDDTRTPGPELIGNCGCKLERTPTGLMMRDCPLHAAAPELLSTLKAIQNMAEPPPESFWNTCEALIKKAEGK